MRSQFGALAGGFLGIIGAAAGWSFEAHAATKSQIACPITPEQKAFVESEAPILVQPDFVDGVDNLVPFNYGVVYKDKDGNPIGKLLPTFNEDARKTLDVLKNKAIVDWSFVEDKGAFGLYFSFFRPYSSTLGKTRNADTECGVLACKKKKIGKSTENGFEITGTVAIGNAHGAPTTATDCEELEGCLLPTFISNQWGLRAVTGDIIKNQNAKDRSLERIDGRVVFVAESQGHPVTPVTDVATLQKDLNEKIKDSDKLRLSMAVIYYPENLDPKELKEKFDGARAFVPYALRGREYHEVLVPDSKELLEGAYTERCPPEDLKAVADADDIRVSIDPSLRREFKNPDGKASGADSFHSWIVVENTGKKPPKDHEAGSRHPVILLHVLTDKVLKGFFTPEQIKEGALVPVRNAWLKEDTQGDEIATSQPTTQPSAEAEKH